MNYKRGIGIIILVLVIGFLLYFSPRFTGNVVSEQGINRVLPEQVKPGDIVKIEIHLNDDVKVLGVSERVPKEWQIIEASDEGIIKGDTIEWLFYPFTSFKKPYVVSYKVRVPKENPNIKFSDGRYVTGQQSLLYAGDVETTIGTKTIYKAGVTFDEEEEEEEEEEESTLEQGLRAHYLFSTMPGTPKGDIRIEDGRLVSDGAGDYVDLGNSDSVNIGGNQITLSAWFYAEQIKGSIISKDTGSGNSRDSQYRLGLGVNKPAFYIWQEDFPDTENDWCVYHKRLGTSLKTKTWYHIVATFNGVKSYIYLDGNEDSSKFLVTDGCKIGKKDTPLAIGGFATGRFPSQGFDGKIDNIRIYNRALSAEEVSELYSLEKSGFIISEETPETTPIAPTTMGKECVKISQDCSSLDTNEGGDPGTSECVINDLTEETQRTNSLCMLKLTTVEDYLCQGPLNEQECIDYGSNLCEFLPGVYGCELGCEWLDGYGCYTAGAFDNPPIIYFYWYNGPQQTREQTMFGSEERECLDNIYLPDCSEASQEECGVAGGGYDHCVLE